MMQRGIILAAALSLVTGAAALAASPEAVKEQPGRFTMQPTEDGFIRLDTATGDVSLCARREAAFECKPVKDDRDLQRELERLGQENRELKAEIERLEEMLGLGDPQKPAPKFGLPTEEDVDKAFSYLQRMFKKFRDKLKELESAESKGTPL